MPRPYWQHPNSLAASAKPSTREAMRRGLWNAALVGGRQLTPGELAQLGLSDHPGEISGWGFSAEGDREMRERLIAAALAGTGEAPIVSAREAEAVAYFVWGSSVAVAARMWHQGRFECMIRLALPQHPRWSEIARWMRPAVGGRPPSRDNVRQYVRSASRKLGITTDQLSSAVVETLRARAAASTADVDGNRCCPGSALAASHLSPGAEL